MSCNPPPETFVNVDKYEKSFGNAEEHFADRLVEVEVEIKNVRAVEVSNGMGSSGFLECERRGRNGLKGSGCSASAFESAGIPI